MGINIGGYKQSSESEGIGQDGQQSVPAGELSYMTDIWQNWFGNRIVDEWNDGANLYWDTEMQKEQDMLQIWSNKLELDFTPGNYSYNDRSKS